MFLFKISLAFLKGKLELERAKQVEPEPLIDTISKPQVLSLLSISSISWFAFIALSIKELLTWEDSNDKSLSFKASQTLFILALFNDL